MKRLMSLMMCMAVPVIACTSCMDGDEVTRRIGL